MRLLDRVAFGLLRMAAAWYVGRAEARAARLREWAWGVVYGVAVVPNILALAGETRRRGRGRRLSATRW